MAHSCARAMDRDAWVRSGARRTGETWKCPCGILFVHNCGEAAECLWLPKHPTKRPVFTRDYHGRLMAVHLCKPKKGTVGLLMMNPALPATACANCQRLIGNPEWETE